MTYGYTCSHEALYRPVPPVFPHIILFVPVLKGEYIRLRKLQRFLRVSDLRIGDKTYHVIVYWRDTALMPCLLCTV